MRLFALVLGSVAAVVAVSACDDSQAWHAPDPSLSRMLDQRRADPYEATSAFADGKVMRTPPDGTLPVDDDRDDAPPVPTHDLLVAGRARFDVVCATCHGIRGDGDSVVATKMENRKPPSLHEPRLRASSSDRIFAVATSGYGLMPSFADMLDTRERWAVAYYVKALQLSRAARVADLPPAMRAELEKEAH
jgi:mono/diheme cytochrome c family protein